MLAGGESGFVKSWDGERWTATTRRTRSGGNAYALPEEAAEQLGLFDQDAEADVVQDVDEALTPEQEFQKFHSRNPRVWLLFERLTLDLIEERSRYGRKDLRIGAKLIYERLRWETHLRTSPAASRPVKLPNNLTPYYARMFHRKHPEMGEVFETRRTKTEQGDQAKGGDGEVVV